MSEPQGIFDDEDENEWFCANVANGCVWPSVDENGFRIRFLHLRDDVAEWLKEHVGVKTSMREIGVWRHDIPLLALDTNFYFKDPNKALLFKLTWG